MKKLFFIMLSASIILLLNGCRDTVMENSADGNKTPGRKVEARVQYFTPNSIIGSDLGYAVDYFEFETPTEGFYYSYTSDRKEIKRTGAFTYNQESGQLKIKIGEMPNLKGLQEIENKLYYVPECLTKNEESGLYGEWRNNNIKINLQTDNKITFEIGNEIKCNGTYMISHDNVTIRCGFNEMPGSVIQYQITDCTGNDAMKNKKGNIFYADDNLYTTYEVKNCIDVGEEL